jgi:NAD(P)-dependent dehydrogenase (short-subunit alcohol dehydrogenase family)
VNNAGTPGPTGKIDTVTAQTLDTVLAVNVRAPFLMIREAVARMATDRGGAGGAIVNISSRAAELGGAGEWIHYAAKRCAGQPDDRCVEGVGGAWDPGERRQPLPDPDRPARPFRFTGPAESAGRRCADGPGRQHGRSCHRGAMAAFAESVLYYGRHSANLRRTMKMEMKTALIVGVGPGLSASLARLFAKHGLQVAMASRDPDKLQKLAEETAGVTFACEATEPEEVAALFDVVTATQGVPDIVVYNASARARGPVTDLIPEEVARAISVSAYGGFLVAQQAARQMVARGSGAILLTGASASVKGYPNSSAFAMGKFALRGLAQSMARELSPKGVHVAHFIIDGGIRSANRPDPNDNPDSTLDPDAIAETYWYVASQPRSAWTWEVELRPWVERF